jgi:hypothetical protein
MRGARNGFKVFIRKPEGKRSLGDLGVCGRIILTFMEEC